MQRTRDFEIPSSNQYICNMSSMGKAQGTSQKGQKNRKSMKTLCLLHWTERLHPCSLKNKVALAKDDMSARMRKSHKNIAFDLIIRLFWLYFYLIKHSQGPILKSCRHLMAMGSIGIHTHCTYTANTHIYVCVCLCNNNYNRGNKFEKKWMEGRS